MTSRTDTGLYFDAEAAAMDKRDRELIPRKLIVAVVSLALAALLIVTFAVLTDRPLAGQKTAGSFRSSSTAWNAHAWWQASKRMKPFSWRSTKTGALRLSTRPRNGRSNSPPSARAMSRLGSNF